VNGNETGLAALEPPWATSGYALAATEERFEDGRWKSSTRRIILEDW
jgi:hypothetical protein